MGFLNRRPKISIEEFCQQFYDLQIFHAIIAGEDVWAGFLGVIFKSVAEVDQSFAITAPTVFKREMAALRIELFGLALMHHLQLEEHCLRELVFTRSYLEQNGQLEIWDIMYEYNKTIARAMELPSREPVRRVFTPLASEEVIQKIHLGFMHDLRTDLSNKCAKTGADPECSARVANRLSTPDTWTNRTAIEVLTDTLVQRLGCQLNTEALLRLRAVVFGLYKGAKGAIESTNLQVR